MFLRFKDDDGDWCLIDSSAISSVSIIDGELIIFTKDNRRLIEDRITWEELQALLNGTYNPKDNTISYPVDPIDAFIANKPHKTMDIMKSDTDKINYHARDCDKLLKQYGGICDCGTDENVGATFQGPAPYTAHTSIGTYVCTGRDYSGYKMKFLGADYETTIKANAIGRTFFKTGRKEGN